MKGGRGEEKRGRKERRGEGHVHMHTVCRCELMSTAKSWSVYTTVVAYTAQVKKGIWVWLV